MNARTVSLLSAGLSLVLAGALVSALAGQAPAATPLGVLSKDGRRALAVTLVNEQEFLALDDLASLFQLAVREEALGAVTVSYKGKTIVLTPDQPLASVAGRLVSLPVPPVRSGRRWLVPSEFVSRAVAPIYDTKIDLRKRSHLLVVGDLHVPRVTMRYDLVAPGARLTIDATPRATSTVAQDNERLTIKFDADALDVSTPPLAPQGAQSLVQEVRLVDSATLAVELGQRVAGFRATSQPIETTTRLTIDVIATQADGAAAPPVAAPAPPEVPPLTAPVSAIRTLAIDPGHGGADQGVTAADGTKEKELALALARRIKAAIEGRLGIRVLLTRDDDRDVTIEDRTSVANNNKADLFISLHANAAFKPAVAGASIYYAAFDKASAGGGAPRPERVPAFGGGLRDIELVAWDLAQTRHLDQSVAFATILEQQFHDRLPLAPRSIDQAPLGVLESANMPAVLVEMGFLTNADQARQLTSDDFQNALVQALADAVLRFRDSLAGAGR